MMILLFVIRTDINYTKAFELFHEAAVLGCLSGMKSIGPLYYVCVGVN
jgi:hypothetical protein